MTILEAINKVLNVARAEIGYHEKASNSQLDDKTANSGSGNWTKYARDIDALKVTWGDKNGFAYCAEWCLWIFYKIFGIDLALVMLCSPNPTGIPVCSYGVSYFKSAGRWYTSNPQAGDIIFFQKDGVIAHQGIVERVDGSIITTIEANTSDMVARRTYQIGSGYVLGFGRPRWDLVANMDASQSAPSGSSQTSTTKPTVKFGDKSVYVEELQNALIKLGYSCGSYGADGEFGYGTLKAVRSFQADNGLSVDGVVGPATWQKIESVSSSADGPSSANQPADNNAQQQNQQNDGVSNEKAIWDKLSGYINNDYGVAGVIGNFYAESVLRSNNVQDTCEKRLGMNDVQYTNAVDNGSYNNFVRDSVGYGLYQATYWSIKQHLLNFAKKANKSIGDRDMQIDAFIDLIKSEYASVWNVLKTATSVRQASDAVLLKFERPADQSTSVQSKRASFGQTFYDKYAGGSATIIGDNSPTEPVSGNQKQLLRYGSTGTSVKSLQEALIKLGYSCGPSGADGEFGVNTLSAVKNFQKDNGLSVDGIVGENTFSALESALNKKNGSDKANSTIITPTSFDVGDIVMFNGFEHFTNANATVAKPCKPGKAKITRIFENGISKHPYHLVALPGGGSSVHGWVDADKISGV